MVNKVTFFPELRLGIHENICNYRKFSGLRRTVLGAFLPRIVGEKRSIGPESVVANPNFRLTIHGFSNGGQSCREWLERVTRVRISMRLLLLKILLGDTSGLQDRACSLFSLAAPK